MRLTFGRALLPLLFVGACSFPDYAFSPTQGGAGSAGSAGTVGVAGSSDTTGGMAGAMEPASCSDQMQGPNETGVDCGGECKACVNTNPLPVCRNNMLDGTETGVDCGGKCPACTVGDRCKVGTDCESGSCDADICQAPTCTDGVENGAESDKDCGGRCPKLCAAGARCTAVTDCATGVCKGSICQAAACNDQVTNGDESGIDCGGKCKLCDNGTSCNSANDCASNSCDATQKLCVDPGCQDGTKNLKETDKDCGGTSCAPCAAGKHCEGNADCESMLCDSASKTCDMASCFDAVANQDESDLNCGGVCPKCPIEKKCKSGADCASGVCQAKVCKPAKMDAPLDQTGWTATASDTWPASSPSYVIDGKLTTRWTSGAPQATGMYVDVDMGKPQYFFTVTVNADYWPGDVPLYYNVFYSLDGKFGSTPTRVVPNPKAVQPIASETVIYARHIRIALAGGGSEWWSIGELIVTQ